MTGNHLLEKFLKSILNIINYRKITWKMKIPQGKFFPLLFSLPLIM